jgi:hypothetical protein
MSGLPEPDWLDLPDAVEKALAAFPGADPAAVKRALVKAFHDAKICTKARCPKWFHTRELMELDAERWDPELMRLGWDIVPDEPDLDCFERSSDDGEKYLFTHIKVQSRGLARWLQHQQPPQASHSPAVPVEAVAQAAETDPETASSEEPVLSRAGKRRPRDRAE